MEIRHNTPLSTYPPGETNSPKTNTSGEQRFNRRTVGTLAAATVLGAGGIFIRNAGSRPKNEVPADSSGDGQTNPSNQVAPEGDNHLSGSGSGDAEQPVESLGIDINKLPYDNVFADREEVNPERAREVLKNGTREEFMELFRTKKAVVVKNGKLDIEKTGDSLVNAYIMGLTLFGDRDSVAKYVNYPDVGGFAEDMAYKNVDIVRAIGSYPDDTFTDQEVMGEAMFIEFDAAQRAFSTRYIHNAQQPGGNFNETLIPSSVSYRAIGERSIEIMWGLTNETGVAHPPLDELDIKPGMMALTAFLEEGTDNVLFDRMLPLAKESPLVQLAAEG